ncbi:uncharacterized protein BYT42DRAFT_610059 [Radiomyces spectabilis]|uniref:uncharacterized protein n=1 Tax=Radiomyces spectabilis TaxID=64574 RepID=UPI002220C0A6|nr:uncharacterized protein BYT42DRAFT_610059 [Radiomyces spectabilis]KAI8394342.1 hypothetical protein BYT42DRAFT_610059 [Radiomyces spectabilis]
MDKEVTKKVKDAKRRSMRAEKKHDSFSIPKPMKMFAGLCSSMHKHPLGLLRTLLCAHQIRPASLSPAASSYMVTLVSASLMRNTGLLVSTVVAIASLLLDHGRVNTTLIVRGDSSVSSYMNDNNRTKTHITMTLNFIREGFAMRTDGSVVLPVTDLASSRRKTAVIRRATMKSFRSFVNQKACNWMGSRPATREEDASVEDSSSDASFSLLSQQVWTAERAARSAQDVTGHEEKLFRHFGCCLTDFWSTCFALDFCKEEERFFWVEGVVPLFKYLGNTSGVVFLVKCEDRALAQQQCQRTPDIWNETSALEDYQHSMDDTEKLIDEMASTLKMDLLRNQNAKAVTAYR